MTRDWIWANPVLNLAEDCSKALEIKTTFIHIYTCTEIKKLLIMFFYNYLSVIFKQLCKTCVIRTITSVLYRLKQENKNMNKSGFIYNVI